MYKKQDRLYTNVMAWFIQLSTDSGKKKLKVYIGYWYDQTMDGMQPLNGEKMKYYNSKEFFDEGKKEVIPPCNNSRFLVS